MPLPTGHRAGHALAGHGRHVLRGFQREAARLRLGHQCGGERMGRALLEAGRQTEDFRRLARAEYFDDLRPSLGERAGLVHGKHADLLGELERLGVSDQDAGLRAEAGADHDRGRRGEAERARAGDHQHGDGIDEGVGEIAVGPHPVAEGQQRDADHHRHEDRRHLVGQTLHRCLRSLRLLDETDDAGQQRVRADAGRLAAQQAVAVDGRREHPVARRLGDRQAFPGQHRLVGARIAGDHLAIDRHRLARPHHHEITGNQALDRQLDQLSVPLDMRGLRLQLDQRLDRGGGLRLGARLEDLAHQHQRDDGRGRLEIQVQVTPAEQPDRRAVEPRHAGAERDEHVHVAGAAADRVPAADVEAPADPELHRRRQRELQPARQQVLDRVERMHVRLEHRGHLRDQWQRQRQRDPEALDFGAVARFLARLLLVARVGGGARRRKAGLDDGRDQLVDVRLRRIEADVGALGRQVDGRLDAGQLVELPLDARRAGGAGHAANGELDHFLAGLGRIHLGSAYSKLIGSGFSVGRFSPFQASKPPAIERMLP